MIKKTLATVAVAASALGVAGAVATPAMAIGGDANGPQTVNGNGAGQAYGNTTTGGYMSPNISLVNGSLNKPCIAVPQIEAQSLVALVNVGVQDLLNNKAFQNCSDNSTQVQGDAPLSHLLSDLSVLSENGVSRH
ncbi:rodlin [Streptomyces sp. NPDC049881]|uniref:rodlin n=1 Tax=unclassified Streptomyces TaxID=2593676 RepID=UPI003413A9F5